MADYVKKRTHIITHEKFLAAGALGRDLYDWGMLWSGHHEKDGEIPMVAVLSTPWGAGGKRNVVVAQKLVDVGLWERTNAGYRVLKWTEQGNVTKAQLEERRRAEREKKSRQRRESGPPAPPLVPPPPAAIPPDPSEVPVGCPGGTPAGVLNSTSLSGEAGDQLTGSERPASVPLAPTPPPGTTPSWWPDAVATASMEVGPVAETGARWLEYDASRDRKGWARNQRDAVGWLIACVRREQREAKTGVRPRNASEITKQPTDPTAPWLQDDYVGKKTGT